MDEPKNIAAVDVIKKLIANIIPDAKVTANYNHSSHCVFYTEDAGPVITLDGDLIDDFNSAIEKHSDTSYRRGLEWTIKFRIYAALASAGVFPNVLISKELLAEEQVWLKGLNVRFDSDPRLDSIFVLGLKALKEFLTNLTVKYPSSTPPEILNELKCVNDILAYYEERKSFSSSGVSETSLGYLKAAAICEIIKKERERDAITIPRILKEKSKEIYSIVAKLRDEYLPQIKMPDCIYDYADSFNSKNSTVKDEANFEKFASCGPMANPICNLKSNIKENFSVKNIFLDIPYTNYDDCEKAIQEVLKAFDLNPVAAKDKLTSNAVLCKVCRLIKCCKYGITDISSGSNSVSYEYGLMHGLGMKVCLLLRKENEKFTDIHGLEHIPYDGVLGFKIAVAKWILNNIESVDVGKVNNYIRQNEAILATTGEISLQKNYPKFKVDALKGISFTETDSIVFKILGDLIIEKNDAGRMVDAGVIMDKAKILGIDENVTMESLEIFESRMRCIKILKNMGLPRTYHVAMLFNGFLHYCENSLSDFNNLFLDTIYLIFNKNLKSSADVSSKLGCKLVVANSIFEYLESHNYISLNQYTSREDVSIFSFTAEGKRYFKDMLKLDVRPRNIS